MSDPARVAEFGQMVGETVAKRLNEGPREAYLRMSNLGRGDRQLYYDIKDNDGTAENLTPSTKIKFLFGDILELLLLFLAEEAGHDVQHKQAEVELNGVKGHIDAIIDDVVVDCKSASQYAFKKFKDGTLPDNDSFGYMEQLAGYSEALDKRDGAFLVIDKTLGHICLDKHSYETLSKYRVVDRIDHMREVLASDTLPERCYPDKPDGASGNRVLGVNCSYCKEKKRCWSDANGGIGLRTFAYSSGPVYLTHVEKEPRVMEITF